MQLAVSMLTTCVPSASLKHPSLQICNILQGTGGAGLGSAMNNPDSAFPTDNVRGPLLLFLSWGFVQVLVCADLQHVTCIAPFSHLPHVTCIAPFSLHLFVLWSGSVDKLLHPLAFTTKQGERIGRGGEDRNLQY